MKEMELFPYQKEFICKWRRAVFRVNKKILDFFEPLVKIQNALEWFYVLLSSYYMIVKEIEVDFFKDEDFKPRENVEELPHSYLCVDINIITGRSYSTYYLACSEKKDIINFQNLEGKIVMNHDFAHARGFSFHDDLGVRYFDSLKTTDGIVCSHLFDRRLAITEVESLVEYMKPYVLKLEELYRDFEKGQYKEEAHTTVLNQLMGLRKTQLPSLDGYQPLIISKLSTGDFNKRLYAECLSMGFFKFIVSEL